MELFFIGIILDKRFYLEHRFGFGFFARVEKVMNGNRSDQPVGFTVFLEIAPVLDLFPDTDFDLSAAVGFRVLL